MSIYNFSVLKSKSITIKTPLGNIKAYAIKFHGKDTWLDYYNRHYYKFASKHHQSTFDMIAERAERAWKGQLPKYGIDTPGYEGRIDFNDPLYKKGLAVYELNNMVAWQEGDGYGKCLGYLTLENGKYKFLEVETSK